MKFARIFLLAALLLSGFSSTAFASDETAGFVRLVPNADPSVPMEMQTRHALQQLMPQILAAKAAGQVISYEASSSSGVLKILYHQSAGLPSFAGKTVFSQMADAMLPAAPEGDLSLLGGCVAPYFALYLYDNYFSAACLTPTARIVGSLRDAGGRVIAIYSGVADGSGNLFYPAFNWSGPYSDVIPGYKVTFKEYMGTTLLATFSMKVPNVKFTSVNKPYAIVRGIGPAGKPGTFEWTHERYDAGETKADVIRNRTISSVGTWQVDFGTTPIRGNDFLSAQVFPSVNFSFSRHMWMPATYCTLGGNYCELYGFPFAPAALQIIHAGTTYNFSGNFDAWGDFNVELKTASGAPIWLVPGDRVSGTGVAQYALPKVTDPINFVTDTVSGKAPANKYFEVWVYVASTNSSYEIYAHSNSTGNYSANFMVAHGLDLVAGQPYSTDIFYLLPTTGNSLDVYAVYGP